MRTARRIWESNQSLESIACDGILKKALNPCHLNRTLSGIRDVNAHFTGKIGPIECYITIT